GTWGKINNAKRKDEQTDFGKLETDILRAYEDFDAVRYRVDFTSSISRATPELKLVSLCYSGLSDVGARHALPLLQHAVPQQIVVPWLSQFNKETVWDEDMRRAGVCAPTSLTMVLRHYGVETTVNEVAKMVFDDGAGIYGNWAFMAAAAGEFGLAAWVERFSSWDAVMEKVHAGIPPIISIAYEAGTFCEAPEKSSAGHLLVVCGCTEEGEIICNDPAAEKEGEGQGKHFRSDELGKAFFGHGGVGIVVNRRL
ncbi:MAG: C39 family peptidase, partial [bacterium]